MNEEYLKRMKEMLGDEYDAYLEAIDHPSQKGFRINTLKISQEDFFKAVTIDAKKSPFAFNGYYTNVASGVGYTPEYLAGFFYMQEPSASSAVTILDVKPGMKVLDLCAAPGSKSTQILEKLDHQGLLVSNEYVTKRSYILNENLEKHGSENVVILNSDTKDIKKAFPCFFDAVLCDAPCSGEGMFRKSDDAVTDWSIQNVEMCAARQREILENAYACLKPGGTLVYSTCTFSKEENEDNMNWFIQQYPDMKIVSPNVTFGRKAFDMDAIRIFPMDGGEGHFICKLVKEENVEFNEIKIKEMKSQTIPEPIKNQIHTIFKQPFSYYYMKNDKVYAGNYPFYDCGKCRIIKDQVLLGTIEKNNRFEPSHHSAMASYKRFYNQVDLNDVEVKKYMHGEQLNIPSNKGWCVLMWHNIGIGLGKSDGKVIKNKYPKGLRLR